MMIKHSKTIKVLLGALVISQAVFADKNVGQSGNKNGGSSSISVAGCVPGKAQTDMDINNIRTTLLTGGDMWWDANNNPKYEVPKGSGLHSIFAGALWIGGVDAAGNIKMAAQTYRQTGNDFWPGAVNVANVSIDASRCKVYDRHWKITKAEVFDFVYNGAQPTKDIKEWPGNGDVSQGEDLYLAPYVSNDTTANPQPLYDAVANHDYPAYNFAGTYPNNICNDYVFGDQTLWWVINDVGDVHSETNGDLIGLEIRCQAFSFKTNDEINNMTFYKYQIINRSTEPIFDTYFGQWVDPDLGMATDDFVGCDVGLGLGYVYNGDADDNGGGGYGLNPPALGVDFFQGPLADPGDGIDNNKDGVIDEPGEQIIMAKFVYYNNDATPSGNPQGAPHFYKYLKGIWGDDQVMTYGGDGRNPANPPCDYMFPGTTDPQHSDNWTEFTAGNTPEDRRFLQSAGKFTLQPGAVNYITTGAVWARTSSGGPQGSVNLVKLADAKAQAIFDNCFQVLDGPNAPDLTIRELSNQLIISMVNYNNDKVELYSQLDATLPANDPNDTSIHYDQHYNFQGYILYQFKDATVTTSDIGNPDKVRTVAEYQCDLKDSVIQLVNHTYDENLGYWVPAEKVNGNNGGINHVFNISTDLFATGDPKLINNKQYYYTVISYAYNNFAQFIPNAGSAINYTQSRPFFQGRNNIKTYTAIPHNPLVENNGQQFGSSVGNIPIITRLEGQGNDGMILDMNQVSLNEAMTGPAYRSYNPVYLLNAGPLNIAVYDPVAVTSNKFDLVFNGVSDTSGWKMTNTGNQKVTLSEKPLGVVNQQILGYDNNGTFKSYGLIGVLSKQTEPGVAGAKDNGFLEASIAYSDETKQWINFIADKNGDTYEDWIRSGASNGYAGVDDNLVYEKILGGTWAPFKLCDKTQNDWSPKWSNPPLDAASSGLSLSKLASVNIVFTSDKTKWTRSAVLEICNNTTATQPAGSNVKKFDVRKSASIDKEGSTATGPDNNDFATGMSWFPGYAINIETGERLNIAFGENSSIDADMKWNPSSVRYDNLGNPVFGGMHYVYVFGHNNDSPIDVPRYDGCRFLVEKLATGVLGDKKNVYKDCMWVTCPMLRTGQGLNSSECTVRLRVVKTFRTYNTQKDVFPIGTAGANTVLSTLTKYRVYKAPATYNGVVYPVGSSFTTDATVLGFTGNGTVADTLSPNKGNPSYNFDTQLLANTTNVSAVAKDALSLINIVPNPYYAYSKYETNQVDSRVRITNLPSQCTISIFTLNGTLIRKYKRDAAADNSLGANTEVINTNTSLDWDLKNTKGIPIASGLYIIHVDAPNLGEKILKFFCVMRPVDLDTY